MLKPKADIVFLNPLLEEGLNPCLFIFKNCIHNRTDKTILEIKLNTLKTYVKVFNPISEDSVDAFQKPYKIFLSNLIYIIMKI